MSLADFFPEEVREKFAQSKVDLGTNILVKVDTFVGEHPKFLIIVAKKDSEVATVVINSEINTNVNWNDYMKSQHVTVPLTGHEDFLEYDSFADCCKITQMPLNAVVEYIKNYPQKVFNISEDVCKKIVTTISLSRLIPLAEKKKYGFI